MRTSKADAKVPGAGTYHKQLIEMTKGSADRLAKGQRFKVSANEEASRVWPGPGAYRVPDPKGASYSLGARFEDKRTAMFRKADGSRFDSVIRSKPHLHPKKADGPGPGDYALPSCIRQVRRHTQSCQRSTFGGSSRNKMNSTFGPGPASYGQLYPKPAEQRAFSNDGYSFPKQGEKGDQFNLTQSFPGPGNYNPILPKSGTAKPMLGGRMDIQKDKPSWVPGPGMYEVVEQSPP